MARGVDGRGDDARALGDGDTDGDGDDAVGESEGDGELAGERGRARGSSPEHEDKINTNTVAAIAARRIDLLVAEDQIGGHGYGRPGPGSG